MIDSQPGQPKIVLTYPATDHNDGIVESVIGRKPTETVADQRRFESVLKGSITKTLKLLTVMASRGLPFGCTIDRIDGLAFDIEAMPGASLRCRIYNPDSSWKGSTVL